MKEKVMVIRRTCDLCGYEMHNKADDRDLDFEEGVNMVTVRRKVGDKVEEVRLLYLHIQAVEIEDLKGNHKEVEQCCSSCLHKLLGTDDGK